MVNCEECTNKIVDAVGDVWCKIEQCHIAQYVIEKFGCKYYRKE